MTTSQAVQLSTYQKRLARKRIREQAAMEKRRSAKREELAASKASVARFQQEWKLVQEERVANLTAQGGAAGLDGVRTQREGRPCACAGPCGAGACDGAGTEAEAFLDSFAPIDSDPVNSDPWPLPQVKEWKPAEQPSRWATLFEKIFGRESV
jgi:hypothetical protein